MVFVAGAESLSGGLLTTELECGLVVVHCVVPHCAHTAGGWGCHEVDWSHFPWSAMVTVSLVTVAVSLVYGHSFVSQTWSQLKFRWYIVTFSSVCLGRSFVGHSFVGCGH